MQPNWHDATVDVVNDAQRLTNRFIFSSMTSTYNKTEISSVWPNLSFLNEENLMEQNSPIKRYKVDQFKDRNFCLACVLGTTQGF